MRLAPPLFLAHPRDLSSHTQGLDLLFDEPEHFGITKLLPEVKVPVGQLLHGSTPERGGSTERVSQTASPVQMDLRTIKQRRCAQACTTSPLAASLHQRRTGQLLPSSLVQFHQSALRQTSLRKGLLRISEPDLLPFRPIKAGEDRRVATTDREPAYRWASFSCRTRAAEIVEGSVVRGLIICIGKGQKIADSDPRCHAYWMNLHLVAGNSQA